MSQSVEKGEQRRSWATLKGTIEGKPMVGIVNTSYATYAAKHDYPWWLRICIPLVDPESTGLATASDGQALERFQQQILDPALRRTCACHFVGRVTQGGWRELWYYVDTPESVAAALNELVEVGSQRRFTFGCYKDEDWAEVAPYLDLATGQQKSQDR